VFKRLPHLVTSPNIVTESYDNINQSIVTLLTQSSYVRSLLLPVNVLPTFAKCSRQQAQLDSDGKVQNSTRAQVVVKSDLALRNYSYHILQNYFLELCGFHSEKHCYMNTI
jgi:hypothetical protein